MTEAAQALAKERGFDLVLNAEGAFYFGDTLDVTQDTISMMDRLYEVQQKKETTTDAS